SRGDSQGLALLDRKVEIIKVAIGNIGLLIVDTAIALAGQLAAIHAHVPISVAHVERVMAAAIRRVSEIAALAVVRIHIYANDWIAEIIPDETDELVGAAAVAVGLRDEICHAIAIHDVYVGVIRTLVIAQGLEAVIVAAAKDVHVPIGVAHVQ